jgi:hypothetical protein
LVDTGNNKIGERKDMDTGNKTVRMGKLIWGTTTSRRGIYYTGEMGKPKYQVGKMVMM